MRLLLVTIFSFLVIPVMAADWQGPDDVLQAASKGNPEAQLEMGILYQFGFHMPGNKMPALAWYLAAAEQGNQSAAERSDLLQKDMLPTEVEEARQLSQNLSALSAISSSTTSNPGHMPDMQEQGMAPAMEPAGQDAAAEGQEAMPEKTMAPKTDQGEVTMEAMPEPLPELGPDTESKNKMETDGPIQPAPAQ